MIKNSTVIKRMVSKSWRPVVGTVLLITAISAASALAEQYLGWDYNAVYWGLFFAVFVGYALKISYDWTRMEIKLEQERMMRDLGKHND